MYARGADEPGPRWYPPAPATRPLATLLATRDLATPAASSPVTLGEFLTGEWLPAKRATVKASTWASYDLQTAAYVVPSPLGQMPLTAIGGPQLTAFYGWLLEHGRRDGRGGLAPKSVRNIHVMLHKALADAVRWERVARNAADAADPPRKHTPDQRVWTATEMRTFLESARNDRLFAAWMLLATTGMRRGEVLGLRWSDVDLERATVTIRQTRVSVGYVVETTTPKSRKGCRTIALPPSAVEALRKHRRVQRLQRAAHGDSWPDSDLVVVRRDGSMIHPQRFTELFNRLVERMGLPAIRLHDLRHSYVTTLLRARVPLKVVSQRIGHSDPFITMAAYQAVLPADDQDAALVGEREILGSAAEGPPHAARAGGVAGRVAPVPDALLLARPAAVGGVAGRVAAVPDPLLARPAAAGVDVIAASANRCPLFALTNRLSPLPVAARVLVNMAKRDRAVDLLEFVDEAARVARVVGMILRDADGVQGRRGLERRAVGWPTGDEAKALGRFRSSFLVERGRDGARGPLLDLALVGVVGDQVRPTSLGARLASAPSAALGEADGDLLGEEQQATLREALLTNVLEAAEMGMALDAITGAGGLQGRLDDAIAAMRRGWSESRVVAHRAAVLGRLHDLGVVEVRGKGPEARIHVVASEDGFVEEALAIARGAIHHAPVT